MRTDEISYGGVESSAFGLTFGTEIHTLLPEKRKVVQEIVGRDGVVDFGKGGYGVRVITVPVYFDGDYAELRANKDRIAQWISCGEEPKRLIFGTEQDRYYLAKVYAGIEFSNEKDRHIGDVQFECNPPWAYLLDGTLLSPEQVAWINCEAGQNQFIKEFDSPDSIRFVNNGTSPVKPVIKLIGYIQSGIELTYGSQWLQLNLSSPFDGIAVDCNNETVTRMSNGDNLSQFIDAEADDFFVIQPGNAEISLSMPGLDDYPKTVTMIIEFEATMGVQNV